MTIETKYNVNDEVFFMNNNGITSSTIKAIHIDISAQSGQYFNEEKATIKYSLEVPAKFYENQLFESTEELTNFLIESANKGN